MFYLRIVFVTWCITFTSATTNFQTISHANKRSSHNDAFETFRLPNNTKPETYDLRFRTWIDQGNLSFTGFVRIEITAIESTNSITLHQRDLFIEDVRVLSAENNSVAIGNVSYDSTFEFLIIPIASANLIEGNTYFVEIQFSGTMMTYSIGLYGRNYWDEDREQLIYYASTQFEATEARSAFPLYDEPAMKAVFTISITHDPSFFALSNMPAETPVPK